MAKLTAAQRQKREATRLRRLRINNVQAALCNEIERLRPFGEDRLEFQSAVITSLQFDDLVDDLCRLAGVAP